MKNIEKVTANPETSDGKVEERELERLRREMAQASTAFHEAEAKLAEKRNADLVGKHFRFRNSCGGDDQWWLYVVVTAVDGRTIQYTKFEYTSLRELTVGIDQTMLAGSLYRYDPVTEAEFRKAWQRVVEVRIRTISDAIMQGSSTGADACGSFRTGCTSTIPRHTGNEEERGSERCRTCGAYTKSQCELGSEVGCDHPEVGREMADFLAFLHEDRKAHEL